jgi:hypothetical protein
MTLSLIPTSTDIFYTVLEHLTDRRDLYAAALTSRDFNKAVTPLLYRTLDTDTRARLSGHKLVSTRCSTLRWLCYLKSPSS